MKNLLTIICFMSIGVTAFGQSPKFNDAMTKALADLDTCKTGDAFVAMANKFDRIAMAEKNQWLPFYSSDLSMSMSLTLRSSPYKIDINTPKKIVLFIGALFSTLVIPSLEYW